MKIKMDAASFGEKITETSFKNNLDIVFNLYLVLRGGRRAYLFESADFDSLERAFDMIAEIKSTFPELKISLENEKANRYLVYKDAQIEKELVENSGDDVWLGKVLGFDCPGDIWRNRDEIRYGVHYYVNSMSFYSEICVKPPPELTKRDIWRPFAEELGYTLTGEIVEILPDIYWYTLVENKNLDELQQKKGEFAGWLDGYGFASFAELVQNNDSIETIYDYLIVAIHLLKYEVFDILYPLTIDQAKTLDKQERALLRDPTTTPENYVQRLMDIAVKDIATAGEFAIIHDKYTYLSGSSSDGDPNGDPNGDPKEQL